MSDGEQENGAQVNTNAKEQPAEESTNTYTDENHPGGESGDVEVNTESKSGEDNANEDKPADSDKPDADDKPIEYDLKAPEGVDEEAVNQFTEKARQLGLTNEQAQSVLDMRAEQQESFQSELEQKWETQTNEWEQQVRKDKELGGDNFDATMRVVSKATDKYATPEFKQALEESGWGNHPELVRVFYRIGKAMSEDGHVGGERSQGGEKSLADRVYGNKG